VKQFWHKYNTLAINAFLVVCLGRYTIDRGSQCLVDLYYGQNVNLAELAFFLHNVVMLLFIMVRRAHVAVDGRPFRQAVAVIAFFSGMAFVPARTDNAVLLAAGHAVITVAMVLSTVTLLNLGRSFGILIAFREVKTGGLYHVIRHPMYATDILWRVGIVLTWPSLVNVLVFLASSAAYVYRAILEEEFLRQEDAYLAYMKQVKYRFVPGIF
jgi:protein-S-isoprenylcysteine O-methyltransferase Ste14